MVLTKKGPNLEKIVERVVVRRFVERLEDGTKVTHAIGTTCKIKLRLANLLPTKTAKLDTPEAAGAIAHGKLLKAQATKAA